MSLLIMPTTTQPTTQLQPQNASNQFKASGAAYSEPLAHSSGSANPLHTLQTAAPVGARQRFGGLRSLLDDPIAVPALYGLLTPLSIPLTRANDTRAMWLYVALPAALAFILGVCRNRKRSGLLTGALLGVTSGMAILAASLFQPGNRPDSTIIVGLIGIFVVCGAALGAVGTGLKQFLVWLFGDTP